MFDLKRVLWVMLAIAVVAAACSGDDSGSDAAVESESLVGVWDTELGSFAVTFEFRADDTFESVLVNDGIFPAGTVIDAGTFVLDSGTLTFESSADAGSRCFDEPGEYSITFDGSDSATIEPVEDACGERRADLSVTLTRATE